MELTNHLFGLGNFFSRSLIGFIDNEYTGRGDLFLYRGVDFKSVQKMDGINDAELLHELKTVIENRQQ